MLFVSGLRTLHIAYERERFRTRDRAISAQAVLSRLDNDRRQQHYLFVSVQTKRATEYIRDFLSGKYLQQVANKTTETDPR